MHRDWEQATNRNDLDAVRRLLDSGADADARDRRNQTALMNAARAGRTELVRILVARGADLDATAKFGLSALMLAVVAGQVEIARILIHAGADLGLRGTGAPGFHGKTALALAEGMERREIAALLAAAGAPS